MREHIQPAAGKFSMFLSTFCGVGSNRSFFLKYMFSVHGCGYQLGHLHVRSHVHVLRVRTADQGEKIYFFSFYMPFIVNLDLKIVLLVNFPFFMFSDNLKI